MAEENEQEFKSYGTWEKRLESWLKLLTLAASIGAVVMAYLSKDATDMNAKFINGNSEVLKQNTKQIDKLLSVYDVVDALKADFRITSPVLNTSVNSGSIFIKGTWLGDQEMLKNHTIWAMVEHEQYDNYYQCETSITASSKGSWETEFFTNLKGNHHLYIILLNKKDSEWLELTNISFPNKGLKALPVGAIVVDDLKFNII